MADQKKDKSVSTAADLRQYAEELASDVDYTRTIQVVIECRKAIQRDHKCESVRIFERLSDGVKRQLERHGFKVKYERYDDSAWNDPESDWVDTTVISWADVTPPE